MDTYKYIQNNQLLVKAGSSLVLMLDEPQPNLEIVVEQDARLDLVVLHEKSTITNHKVTLKLNACINLYYIVLNGDDINQSLQVDLSDSHAEANVYGFVAANNAQKCQSNVIINHMAQDCQSKQLFKQVGAGSANVIFRGRIVVAQDAQHTNALQTCKNLLLSDTAVVHARPQLEIYADDVKCSHGATVGQLDADALFYLRSRGIGLTEAQQLLLLGFAEEVVETISSQEMREKISNMVADKLQRLL